MRLESGGGMEKKLAPVEGSKPRRLCCVCFNASTDEDPLIAPCECHWLVHFGCMNTWNRLYRRCVRCYARNRMFPLSTPKVVVPKTRRYVLMPLERFQACATKLFSKDLIDAELHSAIVIGTLIAFAVALCASEFLR